LEGSAVTLRGGKIANEIYASLRNYSAPLKNKARNSRS
jgi:hypothetical protein